MQAPQEDGTMPSSATAASRCGCPPGPFDKTLTGRQPSIRCPANIHSKQATRTASSRPRARTLLRTVDPEEARRGRPDGRAGERSINWLGEGNYTGDGPTTRAHRRASPQGEPLATLEPGRDCPRLTSRTGSQSG